MVSQCRHLVWRWSGASSQGIGTVQISSDASYFGKMLGFAGISKAAFETDVRPPLPPPLLPTPKCEPYVFVLQQ